MTDSDVTRVGETVDLDALRYDDRGLVSVVVQDVTTAAVLMVAWASRQALERTVETGLAHFWSRSRETLWRKGETSGNELRVVSLSADCDADTVLVRAHATGPACHRGTRTCFDGSQARLELGWLAEVLAARKEEASPETSYTSRLLRSGRGRVAQKVGEEATEVVVAALSEPERLPEEAADLVYHLLVLLESTGVGIEELASVLARRHGVGTASAEEKGGER